MTASRAQANGATKRSTAMSESETMNSSAPSAALSCHDAMADPTISAITAM